MRERTVRMRIKVNEGVGGDCVRVHVRVYEKECECVCEYVFTSEHVRVCESASACVCLWGALSCLLSTTV